MGAATEEGRLAGAVPVDGVDTGATPIAAAIEAEDIGVRGAAAGTARTPDGVAPTIEGLLRGSSEKSESSRLLGAPAGAIGIMGALAVRA